MMVLSDFSYNIDPETLPIKESRLSYLYRFEQTYFIFNISNQELGCINACGEGEGGAALLPEILHCACGILVLRGSDPFGQHQELRPLSAPYTGDTFHFHSLTQSDQPR